VAEGEVVKQVRATGYFWVCSLPVLSAYSTAVLSDLCDL